MPSTVLELCLCGKGSMDQRDCCQGQLGYQLTNHLEVKGTPTRHHEQPFEYPGLAVEKIGQKEKGRWLELWSSPDASVCKGQSRRGDDGLINTCPRAAQLPPVCKQTSGPTFKFDASQTSKRGLVSEQKLPYV